MKNETKIGKNRLNLTSIMVMFVLFTCSGFAQTFNLLSVKSSDRVAQSKLFFVDSEKVINTFDVNTVSGSIQRIADSTMTVDGIRQTMSSASARHASVPSICSLEQNFPNPFNPSTTIRYAVSNNAKVSIFLYDVTGKQIATLVSENKEAGSHDIRVNGSSLASGTYFYTMVVENEHGVMHKEAKKMNLVK